MFGLIRKREPFHFAVFGKHPAAGDYIRLGADTPILNGFSAWMTNGFSRLSKESQTQKGFFWRFWARGPSGKLIVGLVKSSEDSHGRPHPLLVLGEGMIKETLTSHWDILPFFCDTTWHDLARSSGRKITTLKDLKRRLDKFKAPAGGLRPHLEKRERYKSVELPRLRKRSAVPSDFMNKMNNVEGLCRLPSFSVLIDVGTPDDVLIPAVKLLTLVKNRSRIEPGAVFIGGRGKTDRIIVIKRPLHAEDFNPLWTATDEETV